MKFGVMLPHRWIYASEENIVDFSREAESLGFDSLWVTDHLIVPKNKLQRGHIFYESLITLSYVGSITEKAHLGSCILILPIRQPLLLAKQVATLDALTGGRVILGVGAGWIREELEAFSVRYSERGKVVDESIEIMRELWSRKGLVSFEGDSIKFKDMLSFPKPYSTDGPPIWVGGNKKPSIQRAARIGDGWIPWAISIEEYSKGIDLIRNSRKDLDDFTFALSTPVELEKDAPSHYEGYFKEMHSIIAGDLEEVTETIDKYNEVGVEYLVTSFRDVRLFRDGDMKRVNAQLNLFAKEIMPSF